MMLRLLACTREPGKRFSTVLAGTVGLSLLSLPLLFSESTVLLGPGKTRQESHPRVSMPGVAGIGSLRIVPREATLRGSHALQRFLVIGQFDDGLERDVTSLARFSLSPPQYAEVDESGRVRALADGEVKLEAQIDGRIATASLRIEGSEQPQPFSFQRHIGGIMTRRGCNTSGCHGSVKGKGGFKLSLNSLFPADDYRWIVEGGIYQVLTDKPAGTMEPRIDLAQPQRSLLLLKATLRVPHEGGKRLGRDSGDYGTIMNWVRSGAPFVEEEPGRKIIGLEAYPRPVVLDEAGSQQLLVTALLANGRREDVTDGLLFRSNNQEVVKVSPGGLVQAVGLGETAVMIRAPGHEVSVRFGVISEPVTDYPNVPVRNLIDRYVFDKLRKFHIIPSGLSSDEEFLRRVCLDVTGTLPPPRQVRNFLADQDSEKRDKLLEMLLDSPEYVDYWTFRFSDLFRVTGDVYWEWVRHSIAINKPYDQMARERIAAQGFEGPSRFYSSSSKARPVETLVAEDVRVFMGRRLDCAQCHNHPYDAWSQDQFWGLASFYGHLTLTEWVNPIDRQVVFDDPRGHEVDYDGESSLKFIQVMHPRTKQQVKPTFFDGRGLPEAAAKDRRAALAKWMTSHPYFAESIVNRIWSQFLGRGIVDPVDDFGSANPATHPELLGALAQDFREHQHDLKHLIRTIVRSRAYQLSSEPNPTNKNDLINYSHALPRALDAEVLLDAVSSATGVPVVFEQPSGARVPPGTRAIQLKVPAAWESRFMEVFGRPFRRTVPERSSLPSLAQALHALVGSTYTENLSAEGGRIDRLLKADATNQELIEELYLGALSRLPSRQERAEVRELISRHSGIVEHSFFQQSTARREAAENLLWALITSREFAYNH